MVPDIAKTNNLVKKFFNDDFFDDFFNFSKATFGMDKYPFTNVSTKGDLLEFEFALAGYSKEDINISVDNNILTVSGEKKEEAEDSTRKYHTKQIARREFISRYLLPNDVDSDSIEASSKDGIVKISMKRLGKATKQIELK